MSLTVARSERERNVLTHASRIKILINLVNGATVRNAYWGPNSFL